MLNYKDFLKKSGNEYISVVGLGYVGLPLAVLLDSKFNVIGFDVNEKRIEELKNHFDYTHEVKKEELQKSSILFTSDKISLKKSKLIIICVPTPIDAHNIPDLAYIKSASRLVAENLTVNTTIVYESTVYPGLTEEECVPIIEKFSNLKWKKDFHIGYSPERVNPGDKVHTLDKIIKIVSGDTEETLEFLSSIYGEVIKAGIHKTPNIKTAEAAKVIENTQRDLNIALMNELSIIFNKIGINTSDVLEAAATKWNFLKFEPGLVGGHCIGVDPYYLTFKAKAIGYHPDTILAGRKINDFMGKFVAENTVKSLIKAEKPVKNSNVLILGLTFKENINDIRNTKVIDIFKELKEYGIHVHIYDPYVTAENAKNSLNIDILKKENEFSPYDAIILAVKHNIFIEKFTLDYLQTLINSKGVLIDIKGIYKQEEAEKNNFIYWKL
jgi:UDP-N-acetyl-D-galactosamine dehydrogenase